MCHERLLQFTENFAWDAALHGQENAVAEFHIAEPDAATDQECLESSGELLARMRITIVTAWNVVR